MVLLSLLHRYILIRIRVLFAVLFVCWLFGLDDTQKLKDKQAKYFLCKKWVFCYNLSYPHLKFWIIWILKIFGSCFGQFFYLHIRFPKIYYIVLNAFTSPFFVQRGPSIMDYPETSGNLRKPAAEVSGRFPDFSIKKKNRKRFY